MIDWDETRAAFARDGAVFLPQVLDADQLEAALEAWSWSLAHPALGGDLPQAGEARFYQDLYNPRVLEGYGPMLAASPLPAICARLWGTPSVWFMYEQVFLKEGGETRRTPWHQDASYLPIGGLDTAVAWITFEPLAKADSLEFVPRIAPRHALQRLQLRPGGRYGAALSEFGPAAPAGHRGRPHGLGDPLLAGDAG